MALSKHQIIANEVWLEQTISHINEGGYWIWPDQGESIQIIGGKLQVTSSSLKLKLLGIVSQSFLDKFSDYLV